MDGAVGVGRLPVDGGVARPEPACWVVLSGRLPGLASSGSLVHIFLPLGFFILYWCFDWQVFWVDVGVFRACFEMRAGVDRPSGFFLRVSTLHGFPPAVASLARAMFVAVAMLAQLGVCLCQARPEVDGRVLLAKAARNLKDAAGAQRRYACEASVTRERFGPTEGSAAGRLLTSERLRVEVAVFGGRQMFAWPGDGSFRYERLDEMVGSGASGTGEFGPFAASFLTESDPASVRLKWVVRHGGEEVAEYGYRVRASRSHYEVVIGRGERERTGYEGSLFVDAATGGLRRIIIRVTDPPAASGVVRAEADTRYRREEGSARAGLFPEESVLTLELHGGSKAVNRTVYGGCREFRAESEISFGERTGTGAGDAVAGEPGLPPGIEIRTKMLEAFSSTSGAAGDLWEMELARPIKRGGATLAPKGAVLKGRVVEVLREYVPQASVLVAIRFGTLEFDGKRIRVLLSAKALPAPLSDHSGWDPASQERNRKVGPRATGGEPSVARIRAFGTGTIRFSKGQEMAWETQ